MIKQELLEQPDMQEENWCVSFRSKDVEIKWYGSSYIDKKYADVYRNMFTLVEDVCLDDNIEKLAKRSMLSLRQHRRDF